MNLGALIGFCLVAAATPAAAAQWTPDPARSHIGFTATWLGKPLQGSFRRWSAAIDFDPAKPASARIVVDIDTQSAVTGDRTVDGALPGDDWFGVSKITAAKFVASSVVKTGPGAYVAKGMLTIKGKAVPIALPFLLKISGKLASVEGEVILDRRWFALGLGSDATAEYVAFAVPVRISVVATSR